MEDDEIEDLVAYGFSQEQIREWQESSAPPKPFNVLPENWAAVSLMMHCQTQFIRSMSGIHGFDYNAVDVVIKRLQLDVSKTDWLKFQLLENTIVSGLSKSK